jgi:hypothetical protein
MLTGPAGTTAQIQLVHPDGGAMRDVVLRRVSRARVQRRNMEPADSAVARGGCSGAAARLRLAAAAVALLARGAAELAADLRRERDAAQALRRAAAAANAQRCEEVGC